MTARRQPSLFTHPAFRAGVAMLALWCAAPSGCGGSGGNFTPSIGLNPQAPATGVVPNLTESDVNNIVLQAINEANARGKPSTIAVVDRVGNVLTVAQMPGAPPALTIDSGRNIGSGLENRTFVPPNIIPTTMGAIARAITGAYLSSNGNAFTTRTASQILQEHFNPGVQNTPAGPLFGTQFSQLSCSDFNTAASTTPGATNPGPHRSPLGFSPGSSGLPLYKNGVLAGGIGVMSESTYTFDPNVLDVDIDDGEVIAIAGQTGFEPPPQILASNITVNGISLRYTDATPANLRAPVSATGSFTPVAVPPVAVPASPANPGYFAGPAAGHTAIAGTIYGSPDGASGIVPDGTFGPVLYPGTTNLSFVFTDGAGHVLYPPTAGLVPNNGHAITAAEAQALMTSTLNVAYAGRAQIRVPTNSFIQVTVTIVDLDGNVLSQARTPDAPIFGADVSRQKARSAVLFSRTDAAAMINNITAPSPSTGPLNGTGPFSDYITRSRALVEPTVFSDGLAWSEVAVGDIARPFYPDGIEGKPPGSLSLPFARWSLFSTGLQLDLVIGDILNGIVTGQRPAQGCAFIGAFPIPGQLLPNLVPGTVLPTLSGGKTIIANGLQIFSGGFPIYRGNELVGGIGISGDGIQQDSMVAFLGVQNGPSTLANAPTVLRVDQLAPQGIHLRYVNCPAAPFLNSDVQNPC
jgi:uncharacterized protein GlcG (DUF336 family)